LRPADYKSAKQRFCKSCLKRIIGYLNLYLKNFYLKVYLNLGLTAVVSLFTGFVPVLPLNLQPLLRPIALASRLLRRPQSGQLG
jgi:hypothetical protein